MAALVHGFDWPDRFVTGTVGEPGARTFYLQAEEGRRVVSVALEKQQSAALADGVDAVLDQLMADGNPYGIPAQAPAGLADDGPLTEPVEELFRVGDMRLSWDASTHQIVVQAMRLRTDEEEKTLAEAGELAALAGLAGEEPVEEMFVVRIPVGAARAFAARTRSVIAQGRPLCPICEEPMDPAGHICPVPDELE